jgi:hypothetical protein
MLLCQRLFSLSHGTPAKLFKADGRISLSTSHLHIVAHSWFLDAEKIHAKVDYTYLYHRILVRSNKATARYLVILPHNGHPTALPLRPAGEARSNVANKRF